VSRLPLPAWLVLLAVAAASGPAAAGAGGDALREAGVRAEAVRHLFREAAHRPHDNDVSRAEEEIRRLEEALARTPFRGEAWPLHSGLSRASEESEEEEEGGGGRLSMDDALALEGDAARLGSDVRRLMLLRLRYPPAQGSEAGARIWKDRLEQILDEESLRYGDEGTNFFLRLMERIQEKVISVLYWFFSLSPDSAATAVTLKLLVSLLLMLLAFSLGRHLLRRMQARRAAERRAAPAAAPSPLEDPGRYWEEALAAALRGDWERAVREGYLHLLAVLEAAGLTTGEARTNGEVLEDLAMSSPGPAALQAMAQANRVFDRVCYGGRPCGREGWNGFRGAAETLVRRASGGEAGP